MNWPVEPPKLSPRIGLIRPGFVPNVAGDIPFGQALLEQVTQQQYNPRPGPSLSWHSGGALGGSGDAESDCLKILRPARSSGSLTKGRKGGLLQADPCRIRLQEKSPTGDFERGPHGIGKFFPRCFPVRINSEDRHGAHDSISSDTNLEEMDGGKPGPVPARLHHPAAHHPDAKVLGVLAVQISGGTNKPTAWNRTTGRATSSGCYFALQRLHSTKY